MDANKLTTEKKYLLEKQRTRGLNKPEERRLVEIVYLLNKGNLVSDKLVIKINKQEGFNQLQIEKYTKAVELTEKVINSERFKERLLKLELTNTNNKTNQEIYDLMMKGAEILEPLEDKEVDVFITMYYKNNKTVGYTYPSTKDTWVNSKFFDSYTPADVGCNLIHEWLHKLGFDHTSAREHTSVPYAVGYLVEDCIEEMEEKPYLYNDELPPPIPEEKKPLPNSLPETTLEANPVSKQKRVCKKLWYTLWIKEVCWYE